MRNEFHIHAIVTGQEVTFIGCTKGDVPSGQSAFVSALHEALTTTVKKIARKAKLDMLHRRELIQNLWERNASTLVWAPCYGPRHI